MSSVNFIGKPVKGSLQRVKELRLIGELFLSLDNEYSLKPMRIFISTFLIAIGALAIISGESDDSPGLQGLGLILIVAVLLSLYRGWRRN
jgi:hypothetical protein